MLWIVECYWLNRPWSSVVGRGLFYPFTCPLLLHSSRVVGYSRGIIPKFMKVQQGSWRWCPRWLGQSGSWHNSPDNSSQVSSSECLLDAQHWPNLDNFPKVYNWLNVITTATSLPQPYTVHTDVFPLEVLPSAHEEATVFSHNLSLPHACLLTACNPLLWVHQHSFNK